MNNIAPFKAKIGKSGNSRSFIVPAYLIRAGIIDPKKEYEVQLKQVKK